MINAYAATGTKLPPAARAALDKAATGEAPRMSPAEAAETLVASAAPYAAGGVGGADRVSILTT